MHNSLFINDQAVTLTQVNIEDFKQWLTDNTDRRFKTPTQAIKSFLSECKGFVLGMNKISLTAYIGLKKVYENV